MSQFANLPQIGTLTLEHTFYEYGEPVLFVCTDQAANRYLCSCCRLSEEWLIAKTCPKDLIDVIDDALAFSDIFYSKHSSLFFLTWDGDKFSLSNNVPADAYPDVGSYLELPADTTAEYRNMLESYNTFWNSPQYFAEVTLPSTLSKSEAHTVNVELRMSAVFKGSLSGYVRAHTLAASNVVYHEGDKRMFKISSTTVAEQSQWKSKVEQTVSLSGFMNSAA